MQPNDKTTLTIMMPAYGEAENLKLLLPAIKEITNNLAVPVEILVLDAQSPMDNTQAVCVENQVKWLPRTGGDRYGDAVRTGIRASTGEFVITMDSDGSHNPQFIHELWKKRFEADVVIASRYAPGGVTENPWVLVAMSRLLNVTFKLFVGMPVYDISNSFRLYRGDLLRKLELKYANFDILEEILVKIIWGNFTPPATVLEIPFRFEQRKHGKPKRKLLVFSAQFVSALFKLRRIRAKSMK